MTLKELQNQLAGMEEYQAKDEAALRAQAESVYKPQYEQDLLMLRDNINANLAQQQRNAVATGMQRSSYNQAQQNLLRGQGLRAQGELGAAYEGNVGNALLNLMNQEQGRKTAADQYRNQLLMSIYEYGRGGSGGSGTGTANAQETTLPNMLYDYINGYHTPDTNALSGAVNSAMSGINKKKTGIENLNSISTSNLMKQFNASHVKTALK